MNGIFNYKLFRLNIEDIVNVNILINFVRVRILLKNYFLNKF